MKVCAASIASSLACGSDVRSTPNATLRLSRMAWNMPRTRPLVFRTLQPHLLNVQPNQTGIHQKADLPPVKAELAPVITVLHLLRRPFAHA